MSTPRALWLAWGAVVALLAYPAASQTIGEQSGIMGGDSGFLRPVGGAPATLTIDAMPYARTVTCGSYTLTGSASGAGAVSWSASPSGESGSCTGTTSWSCVVSVAPDATGEGVETITVSQSGGASDTETIGFYVNGAHSCFLAQSVDGSYNSTLADLDPVATWENLGSSALDVTQGTGTAQPTYRTGIVGGQPVVRCDGGDRLAASAASDWIFLHNGTDTTVIASLQTTSANPNALMNVVSTAATVSTSSRGFVLFLDDRASVPRNNLVGAIVSKGSAPSSILISSSDDDYPSAAWGQITYSTNVTAAEDGFLYSNGTSVASIATTSTFSTLAPVGALTLCSGTAGAEAFTGDVFVMLAYQVALTKTQREINDAVTAWATASFTAKTETWFFVGDSLTAGSGGVTPWPNKLETVAPSNVGFTSRAKGGATSAQILAQWRLNKHVDRVFVLGGINDIAVGTSAATAFASLNTLYAEAQTAGVDVVAMSTLPFGNAASWTAGRQTELESLNASVLADTDVDTAIDLYTVMGEPGTPIDLAAAYDNGDGVHPNEAGTAEMSSAVATALGL